MAVYGKFRERWDPTKRKAKISKNITVEFINGDQFDFDKKLLFAMMPESLSNTTLTGTKALLPGGVSAQPISLAVRADSLPPELVRVDNARFKPKAIRFPKDSSTGNRCYVESAKNAMSLSTNIIAGIDNKRSYDTFVSFWVKVDTLNFGGGSSGHNIGGFYRLSEGSQANNDVDNVIMDNLAPGILFNITESGTMMIRFCRSSIPNNRVEEIVYESNASGNKITPGNWHHVTFVIKRIEKNPYTNGSDDYYGMVEIYIDGVFTGAPAVDVHNMNLNYFNDDHLEFIIGNQEFGYEASVGQNLADDDNNDGFYGAIGEFIIFTQPSTGNRGRFAGGLETQDGINRRNTAKFIYEAQTQGVYNLHSGFHTSSPRLEQLDLDRDTSYPSTFSMNIYSKFSDTDRTRFYDTDRDPRNSLRSHSKFIEGYE